MGNLALSRASTRLHHPQDCGSGHLCGLLVAAQVGQAVQVCCPHHESSGRDGGVRYPGAEGRFGIHGDVLRCVPVRSIAVGDACVNYPVRFIFFTSGMPERDSRLRKSAGRKRHSIGQP